MAETIETVKVEIALNEETSEALTEELSILKQILGELQNIYNIISRMGDKPQ